MTHPLPRPTKSLLETIKRSARAASRQQGTQYSLALDDEARKAGYSDWHGLHEAWKHTESAVATSNVPQALPIDPDLPEGFYHTPNDDRPEDEIDAWWDRPYLVTRKDAGFDVRCLDGGAWDRPTFYGVANSVTEAEELAARKLANWRKVRAAPFTGFFPGEAIVVMRMPQRPGASPEILKECTSQDEAAQYLAELRQQEDGQPS